MLLEKQLRAIDAVMMSYEAEKKAHHGTSLKASSDILRPRKRLILSHFSARYAKTSDAVLLEACLTFSR